MQITSRLIVPVKPKNFLNETPPKWILDKTIRGISTKDLT